MPTTSLLAIISDAATMTAAALDRGMPAASCEPTRLHEAMRYAVKLVVSAFALALAPLLRAEQLVATMQQQNQQWSRSNCAYLHLCPR